MYIYISWPRWDLNPRPMNSVQTLYLSYQVMSSTCTQSQLSTVNTISSFVQCRISFRLFIVSHHISFRYVCIYIYIYIIYIYFQERNKKHSFFTNVSPNSFFKVNFQIIFYKLSHNHLLN